MWTGSLDWVYHLWTDSCNLDNKLYKEVWNATHTPDPINATLTTLEEEVAQLQTDNEELMSRVASVEESIAVKGKIIKPTMKLAAIAGFILVDFI
jgi:uncharacterized protein YoxC